MTVSPTQKLWHLCNRVANSGSHTEGEGRADVEYYDVLYRRAGQLLEKMPASEEKTEILELRSDLQDEELWGNQYDRPDFQAAFFVATAAILDPIVAAAIRTTQ